MKGQLKVGTKLTSSGNTYIVKDMLGSGGQGEVYLVIDSSNHEHALKWYFKKMATPAQKKILDKLVMEGSPDPCFLWPEDLIEAESTFGYIMPLRTKKYASIVDLVKRKVEPSFLALCKAAFNLTQGYQKLHSKGFSYRDISFGNLFLDPDTGDVLICDNDNVSADGVEDSSVFGTPRFMAPEIVRGEAKPSRNTDRYSLAVLLFYMFMMHHPLEGALEYQIHCMDVQAMNKLFGFSPVFIFDPVDASNRPVREYQDNALIYWPLYPQYLRDLFTRAFTDGLKEPTKRITEPEWLDAFANMISSIYECPKCKAELFYDPVKAEQDHANVCWHCKSDTNMPCALNIKKQVCVMAKSKQLLRHQIFRDGDIKNVAGTVVTNPKDPSQLGIRNETQENWIYTRPDGTQTLVSPGRSARIVKGCSISFGLIQGEFK